MKNIVKTRILVADDEKDILDMVSFILTHAGYSVVSVSDGLSAIEAIESDPPDLAILDIQMPGMSGIEVLRRVRKNESVKDLTVILMTVLSSDSDLAAGFAAGADNYVTKPAVLSSLLQIIQSSLARKENSAVSDSKGTSPPNTE